MDKFSGFLIYIAVPITMLYALIMSFIIHDFIALLISAVGTIAVMFMVGRCFER